MYTIVIALIINDSFTQVVYSEDSLKQVLVTTYDDSSKAVIFMQLASSVGVFNREKSIEYYSEALKYAKNKSDIALILDKIGLYNWQLGNFEEAIGYLNKSLILFTELEDSLWLGKVYNNLAVVNWELGNTIEALEYYHSGLKIRRAIKDQKGVSNILNNIGLIYQDWGLYDEAFKWHNDALKIAFEIKEFNAIAYSYINIGKCYEQKNSYTEALEYYQLGYENLSKEENNHSLPLFLSNIGSVYSKMGKLDSALFYYNKSLIQSEKVNNKNRIALAEYFIGKTYFSMNKIDLANKFVSNSYAHSVQYNYNNLIRDNLFVLSGIEEKKGNISQAFQYYKKASDLKDSTFNKEKIAKFTKLQIKYNLDNNLKENMLLRKNNEIQELTISNEKIIRVILIISSISILIVLLIITKSHSSVKKLNMKLTKSEKDLIKTNANKDKFFSIISHDLKSPFSGILGLSELLVEDYDDLSSKERKEMIQLLNNLSEKVYALLEDLLQWAQTQNDSIKYVFEKIDIHEKSSEVIELLKTNASNKNISLENKVIIGTFAFADTKATETVLRNLVTNAIKFTKPSGVVKIEAEKGETEIAISVTDSGIGMSEQNKNKLFKIEINHSTIGTNDELGTGVGLILCKELVEKQGGKIWVESELNKGSKFVFTLPIEQ